MAAAFAMEIDTASTAPGAGRPSPLTGYLLALAMTRAAGLAAAATAGGQRLVIGVMFSERPDEDPAVAVDLMRAYLAEIRA